MIIDKTTLASTVLDGGDEGEKEEKSGDSPSEGTTPSAILLDGDGEKSDDASSEEKSDDSSDSPKEGGEAN